MMISHENVKAVMCGLQLRSDSALSASNRRAVNRDVPTVDNMHFVLSVHTARIKTARRRTETPSKSKTVQCFCFGWSSEVNFRFRLKLTFLPTWWRTACLNIDTYILLNQRVILHVCHPSWAVPMSLFTEQSRGDSLMLLHIVYNVLTYDDRSTE